ncbi:MAG: hypothetical protein ACYSU7_07380 [Planctomycetota bacterium]|jgi:DNA repair exonuclease SbcCD ATPase subunit
MNRHWSKLAPAGLIVLAVVLASAVGQTGRYGSGSGASDSDIRVLQETVRLHGVRIEQLEARAGRASPSYLNELVGDRQAPPPGPPSGAGRMPTRIMIVDGMEMVEPDPAADQEIENLQREIDALERTVDQKQQRVGSMTSGGSSGYHRRYKNTSSSRRRTSEGQLLADYQTKLRNKKGELKRLERELNEPKQIIHGHWESTIISLETTRDQSRALDRMDQGGYLTWEGRRLSANANSQEWVVTRIEVVDPANVDAKE